MGLRHNKALTFVSQTCMSTAQYFLIVPASGIGTRMASAIPKQYLKLDNGLSVLDQTLKTLLNIPQIKGCVIAIAENDREFKHSEFAHHPKLLSVVKGGEQRFYSVINALNALKSFANDNDWVLVHDAVRPCVKEVEVIDLIKQLAHHPTGGLLASPVIDTLKRAHNASVESTLDRENIWLAQTPQMYRLGILSKALDKVVQNNLSITDDASSIEHLGLQSVLVNGSSSNIKITRPEDLTLANFYLKTHD